MKNYGRVALAAIFSVIVFFVVAYVILLIDKRMTDGPEDESFLKGMAAEKYLNDICDRTGEMYFLKRLTKKDGDEIVYARMSKVDVYFLKERGGRCIVALILPVDNLAGRKLLYRDNQALEKFEQFYKLLTFKYSI